MPAIAHNNIARAQCFSCLGVFETGNLTYSEYIPPSEVFFKAAMKQSFVRADQSCSDFTSQRSSFRAVAFPRLPADFRARESAAANLLD